MPAKTQAPVNLYRAEFSSQHYFLAVGEDTTIEMVMAPEFWVNVRSQLRVYDVITIISDTYDIDLRVTSISAVSGKIDFRIIRTAPASDKMAVLVPPVLAASGRYDVKSRGFGRWAVMEIATGNIVSDGLSKDAALSEKAELEKRAA